MAHGATGIVGGVLTKKKGPEFVLQVLDSYLLPTSLQLPTLADGMMSSLFAYGSVGGRVGERVGVGD
eukprot:392694-Rhodomonas_salina.1